MLLTDIVARPSTSEDAPAFLALLAQGWPGSNGYHSSVLERWASTWPSVLSEFEAFLVIETSRGIAGYAGIQRHPIAYTGGLERALADHFLSSDMEPAVAIAALMHGLGDWGRERGIARVTLNMEPEEHALFEGLRCAGAFPERIAMYTGLFPEDPFDPSVREARLDERPLVVEMGARIAEHLTTYSGTLVFPTFAELVEQTDQAYRDYGSTRPHTFFLAERDGRPVGFLFAILEAPDGGLIYDLYVDPAYRRRGISRALYRTAAAWLQERGAQWLTLSVYQENRPAITAYETWGFFPFFMAWELNL